MVIIWYDSTLYISDILISMCQDSNVLPDAEDRQVFTKKWSPLRGRIRNGFLMPDGFARAHRHDPNLPSMFNEGYGFDCFRKDLCRQRRGPGGRRMRISALITRIV